MWVRGVPIWQAWGGYVAEGRVSCSQGKFLIHREFSQAGVDVGTGEARYRDGWVCGGQMGYYFCRYPYSRFVSGKYTREVDAQACKSRGVGCPGRVARLFRRGTPSSRSPKGCIVSGMVAHQSDLGRSGGA